MYTLIELRAAIKTIGFNVTTKRLSWGPHATYVHLASGEKLAGNVFTLETREKWVPLWDFLKEHRDAVAAIAKAENIVGLKNPGSA